MLMLFTVNVHSDAFVLSSAISTEARKIIPSWKGDCKELGWNPSRRSLSEEEELASYTLENTKDF